MYCEWRTLCGGEKSLWLRNRYTVHWRFWRLLISEFVSSESSDIEGPKSFEIAEISNFSVHTIPKTFAKLYFATFIIYS